MNSNVIDIFIYLFTFCFPAKRFGQKSAKEIVEAHRIKRQLSKLKLKERKKAGDTGNLKKRSIGDAQDE
jgi:hypothetical protein